MGAAMRALGAVAVGCSLVLATPSAALAHPRYKSSDPPSNGEVSRPPTEVYVEFSEPITSGSSMDITDPCGRNVDSGDAQVGATSMTQGMAGSAAGEYTVDWRALGADGHPIEGSFSFTSTGGEPCPGDEPASGGGESKEIGRAHV